MQSASACTEAAVVKGRKRKTGRRHPSGKLVQPGQAESQRDAMATVLAARQRHFGISARQARDERLGTALGRMAFAGKITGDQFAAGELYGELIARCNAVMGFTHHRHGLPSLMLLIPRPVSYCVRLVSVQRQL